MDQGKIQTLLPWLTGTFAFILGSIPFGLLVARIFKVKDLTQRGSGNIGATNVARVIGFWPAGVVTLALDMFKGSFPVLLVSSLGVGLWEGLFHLSDYQFSEVWIWSVGLLAVLGHCYSPWLQFRGGKGVATGFGVILVLSPWSGLVGLAAFLLTFIGKRTGSLSSLVGLLSAATTHLMLYPMGSQIWVGAAIVFLILLRHESNINALLENREKTF